MVWGLVAHLIADWPLQNDWMARGKRSPWTWSVAGLMPPFVHGLIHTVAAGIVFGYWVGVAIGLTHIAIDTGKPVAWWSRLMRQTQPGGLAVHAADEGAMRRHEAPVGRTTSLYDIGTEVRFWTDQVFHIAVIAVAALIVGSA